MIKLEELEKAFNNIEWKPFKLGCETISNPKQTIESHLKYLKANKANKANKRYLPYYKRLVKIYNKIEAT